MSQAKQIANFGYCWNVSVPDAVKEGIKRTGVELMYLVTPEDTTDGAAVAKSETGSIVKTLFWVGLSVAVTLLLGQLH